MKSLIFSFLAFSIFSRSVALADFNVSSGNMRIQTEVPNLPLVNSVRFGIGVVLNDDKNCGVFDNGVLTLPLTSDQFPAHPAALKMTNSAESTVLLRINHSVSSRSGGDFIFFTPIVTGNIHLATSAELHGADPFGVISLRSGESVYVVFPTPSLNPSNFTEVSVSCKTPESMILRPKFSYGTRLNFGTWNQ